MERPLVVLRPLPALAVEWTAVSALPVADAAREAGEAGEEAGAAAPLLPAPSARVAPQRSRGNISPAPTAPHCRRGNAPVVAFRSRALKSVSVAWHQCAGMGGGLLRPNSAATSGNSLAGIQPANPTRHTSVDCVSCPAAINSANRDALQGPLS